MRVFVLWFSLCFFSLSLSESAETWTSPVNLSAAGINAITPSIAINDSGQAACAWVASQRTQCAQLAFGGSWASSISHQSTLAESCFEPIVKVNGLGQILLAWGGGFLVEPYGVLLSASCLFNKAWTTPNTLYMGEIDINVDIALTDGGDAVAVINNNVVPGVIKAAKWSLGGNWGDNAYLSSDLYPSNYPRVAMNNSGRIAIVWQQNNGINNDIYGLLSAFNGNWPSMWPLYGTRLSNAGYESITPQVCVNDSNHIEVVWSGSNGSNTIIQGRNLTLGEEWSSVTDLSLPGQDAQTPKIAMNASGHVVVVWSRWDGAHHIVQAVTKDVGAGWSAPVDLSSAGNDSLTPEVAINEAEQMVCVWKGSDGLNTIIQGSIASFGGSWSTPVDLSAPGQNADQPKVVMNSGGQVIVGWIRSDGTHTIVQSTTTIVLPLPPQNLTGYQIPVLFFNQTQYANRIYWEASPSSNVIAYRVYREGVLIATLTKGLWYEDKNQVQGVAVKYEIAAVSSGGAESVHSTIYVP